MCKNAINLSNVLWREWDKGVRNNEIQNKQFIQIAVEQSQYCASCGCQKCAYELNRFDRIFVNEADKWVPANYCLFSYIYGVLAIFYAIALWFLPKLMEEYSLGYRELFSLVWMICGMSIIDEWVRSVQRNPNRQE
jgi:hypothetical protein